ncbi:MAG: GNAT family N-acetyltransferase [Pseudoxanthomonas sp.]
MRLQRLEQTDADRIDGLVALLRDVIGHGASVGFLATDTAQMLSDYWRQVLDGLGDGLALWVAEEDGKIVGSVQLAPCQRSNGRHRADLQKLMVLESARGKGIATRLLHAAEAHARELGLTLLVLDTHSGSPAESLYRREGWQEAGSIPEYAGVPDGTLVSTTYFYKKL